MEDGSNIMNKGIAIRPIPDRAGFLAAGPGAVRARIWSIKRTIDYGSDHHHHHERSLEITAASLSADGHTGLLNILDISADPAHGDHVPHPGQGRRDGERGD